MLLPVLPVGVIPVSPAGSHHQKPFPCLGPPWIWTELYRLPKLSSGFSSTNWKHVETENCSFHSCFLTTREKNLKWMPGNRILDPEGEGTPPTLILFFKSWFGGSRWSKVHNTHLQVRNSENSLWLSALWISLSVNTSPQQCRLRRMLKGKACSDWIYWFIFLCSKCLILWSHNKINLSIVFFTNDNIS